MARKYLKEIELLIFEFYIVIILYLTALLYMSYLCIEDSNSCAHFGVSIYCSFRDRCVHSGRTRIYII